MLKHTKHIIYPYPNSFRLNPPLTDFKGGSMNSLWEGTLRSIEGDPTQYILYLFWKHLWNWRIHFGIWGDGVWILLLDLVIVVWTSEVRSNQNTFWKRTRVECCRERIFPEKNLFSFFCGPHIWNKISKDGAEKKMLISGHSLIS